MWFNKLKQEGGPALVDTGSVVEEPAPKDITQEPLALTDAIEYEEEEPIQAVQQQQPHIAPQNWLQRYKSNPADFTPNESEILEIQEYLKSHADPILHQKILGDKASGGEASQPATSALDILRHPVTFNWRDLLNVPLTNEDLWSYWRDSYSSQSIRRIGSVYFRKLIAPDPALIQDMLSKDFHETLQSIPTDDRASLNLDLSPYVDQIDASCFYNLTTKELVSLPVDTWQKIRQNLNSIVDLLSTDLMANLPEEIRDIIFIPRDIRFSTRCYPYLTLKNLKDAKEYDWRLYRNLMESNSLDDAVYVAELDDYRKWLFSTPDGIRSLGYITEYAFAQYTPEQKENILQYASLTNIYELLDYLSEDQLFDRIQTSIDFVDDKVYDKLSDERLNEAFLINPSASPYWNLQLISRLKPEVVMECFENDHNFYGNAHYKLKEMIGKRVFDASPNLIVQWFSFIPDSVFDELTIQEKADVFERVIVSPHANTLGDKIWRLVETPEQALKALDYVETHDIPPRYLHIFEQYAEKNLNISVIPDFTKSDDANNLFKNFYDVNPDDGIDYAFVSMYGKAPQTSIKALLGQWDAHFSQNRHEALIMYAAERMSGTKSKMNRENEELLDIDSESDWDNVDEVVFGLKKIYENTQSLFKQSGITHLPIVRFVKCSLDNIEKRFQPDVSKVIRDNLATGKPFMLTFSNQPFQGRSLSSCSFNPIAVYSQFGYPDGEDTLSVKWFMNVPVENILATKGSIMVQSHPSEDEVIGYNLHGFPATLVVSYDYDQDGRESRLNFVRLKKALQLAKCEKEDVPDVKFSQSNVIKNIDADIDDMDFDDDEY